MGDIVDWLLTALTYLVGLWLWALLLLTVLAFIAMPFVLWRDR